MMRFANLHIVGQGPQTKDVSIDGAHITKIENRSKTSEKVITFDNALAFPGLINSHDHLEFNLFPQLPGGPYENYLQWGTDIHSKFKSEIDKVNKIPPGLRAQWGILKNFLNGVTTVVDHGMNEYSGNPWVDVFEGYTYLHSVGLEKRWKLKLNNPFYRFPVVVHIGEGTDQTAKDEIDQLIRWNFFRKKLVGIHGIAMTEKQAQHFEALIWCPDSNMFLYNSTAHIDQLKKHVPILFGTDSALSASANLWDHLRLARKTGCLSDEELFASLTKTPTAVWGLEEGLKEQSQANLIVAKRKSENIWDAFYSLQLEDILMIVKNGHIKYFDVEIKEQMDPFGLASFTPVYVSGREKYIVKDAVALLKKINSYDVQLPLPITLTA